MRSSLLLLTALAACAGGASGAPSPAIPAAPSAERAEGGADVAAPSVPSPSPVAAPVAADDVPAPPAAQDPGPLKVVVPTARLSDDGGIVVDLESDGWPGRASSPALIVGQERYENGEHPSPTVLRFELPAGAAFPAGAPCSVWYGEDEVARFVAPEVTP